MFCVPVRFSELFLCTCLISYFIDFKTHCFLELETNFTKPLLAMQIFGTLSNKESSDKKRYNNSRCSYLIHVPA